MKKKLSAETIITSHNNADFDAVASMLAAHKLYPESKVIFPGSQEKNLRNFFISSMSYLFNMADAESIDFSTTKRLVLVDTKQPQRLTQVSALLDRDDIEIHIYDHHPAQENDLKGSLEITRLTGATVTLLTEIIRENKVSLTPEEATIMALGIYEDTGSFTYSSTTEQDFLAAGFLLSCGACLNTIASLVVREISPDQISWLNDLLNEKITHRINGFDITVSTISSTSYIPDLATVVQKAMKIENMDVFFAVVLMGNKITIIARSRIPEVDVGKILSCMGGGGHSYAASAKLSEITLAQAEQQLLEFIRQEVKSTKVAKELMSSPAITIPAITACRDANRLMTRYNINALLVSGSNPHDLKGYITRQTVEKTLHHKLDHLPVVEYMSTELTAISPDADIPEIENKIIDGKQRILPVIDKAVVIGVITRTDLLNYLVQRNKFSEQYDQGETNAARHAKKKNILNFIDERLSPRIIELLKAIGKAGDDLGYDLYVVGGFVRDLLLYRSVEDIDIVVEGDGIAFARNFSEQQGGRFNAYRKFGTAVVILPDGFKVDVASARLEYYKAPAALPTVEMSSIKLDLFRRDFTINTLAIHLNHEGFGTLIDFFGGQRDLKDKTIRIIHNMSFVEDPTRVFRAIRFANRYDFTIGKLTSSLIQNAVKIDFFKDLSGIRVFSELRQILEEENPIPAIETLKTYGLEKVIHPELLVDTETVALMKEVKKALSWHDLLYTDNTYSRWAVYFMVLIKRCSVKVSDEICNHLKLAPKQTQIVHKLRLKAEDRLFLIENSPPVSNSSLYAVLIHFKTELILYMMAIAKKDETRKAISFFYTQLKEVMVSIRGQDLLALGVKPGPAYRKIMQSVLDARLDGKVETLEDELQWAISQISANKRIDL
ncbi:MAG: CBS domain-containing protein [Pseudomonadota bacterium]